MKTNPDSQDLGGEILTTDPIQEYFEGEFSVTAHEDYNKVLGLNDIALIKLHHPARTNQANIDKIRLPFNYPNLPQRVVATGFGLNENITISNTLRRGSMTVLKLDECLNQYIGVEEMRPITEKQFCAKEVVDGVVTVTCLGDSGGPMQMPQLENGKLTWIQFGITSWGANKLCGYINRPSVAVNVYSYLDWILDNAGCSGKKGLGCGL